MREAKDVLGFSDDGSVSAEKNITIPVDMLESVGMVENENTNNHTSVKKSRKNSDTIN